MTFDTGRTCVVTCKALFSTSLIRYILNVVAMVLYACKKCGKLDSLPPQFWNITDFGAECEKCEMINTITLEKGELKKLV